MLSSDDLHQIALFVERWPPLQDTPTKQQASRKSCLKRYCFSSNESFQKGKAFQERHCWQSVYVKGQCSINSY